MATKKENGSLLVPLDKYLSAGAHIGTKFRTKDMQPFIYKINLDGLAVLNVEKINERLALAAKMLAKYEPASIAVVGRRENSWRPIKVFAKIIGGVEFSGHYRAGTITNPQLETYFEPQIILVTDPWPDKNAVNDAIIKGIPIIALCDTNNTLNNIDLVIPCNNKGAKSLALIYWILTNEYLHEIGKLAKKKDLDVPVEKFSEET